MPPHGEPPHTANPLEITRNLAPEESGSPAEIPGFLAPLRSLGEAHALAEDIRSALLTFGANAAMQAPPTTSESAFLARWEDVLPPETWRAFLLQWARALEAYETPLSFIDTVTYRKATLPVWGTNYEFIESIGGQHFRRREFMAAQPSYTPLLPREAYPPSLELNTCKLCGNIAQSIDAALTPELGRSNALLRAAGYTLVPNKYPGHPGHVLLIPDTHDHALTRVSAAERGALNESRTVARILSVHDLLTLFITCDELRLVGSRNHPRDAMSIPEHDHFHLIPRALFPRKWFTRFSDTHGGPNTGSVGVAEPDATSAAARNYFPRRAAGTPFDTLLLTAPSAAELAHQAQPILERLERLGVVWTLYYADQMLFVSPRRPLPISHPQLSIGAAAAIHCCGADHLTFIQHVESNLVPRGEFNFGGLLGEELSHARLER